MEVDYTKVCRTCLSSTSVLKSIFSSHCDSTLLFSDMVMSVAAVKIRIEKDDGLPIFICLKCINRVTQAYSFAKECEKSETFLLNTLQLQEPDTIGINEDMYEGLKEEIREENLEEESEKPETQGITIEDAPLTQPNRAAIVRFMCSICQTYFTRKTTMAKHMKRKHDIVIALSRKRKKNDKQNLTETNTTENNKMTNTESEDMALNIQQMEIQNVSTSESGETFIKCSQCDYVFANTVVLKRHMYVKHRERKDSTSMTVERKDSPLVVEKRVNFTPKTMEKENSTPETMEKNDSTPMVVERENPTPITMERKYSAPMTVERKDSTPMTVERKYSTPEAFGRKRTVSMIVDLTKPEHHDHSYIAPNTSNKVPKSVETSEKRKCSFCSYVFTTQALLKKHLIAIHLQDATPKVEVCELCQEETKYLQQHMEQHFRDLYCKKCDKKFLSISNYEGHMRRHNLVKPYLCNGCGKGFSSHSNLKAHLLTHSGEKPHDCEHCGRQFTTFNSLKIHIRTHTGEKPYVCEVCGRPFRQKSDLNAHKRVHERIKVFNCNVCSKMFTTSSQLNSHMKTHTGERPHACDVCGDRFTLGSTLRKHLRTHTGERPFTCSICGKGFSQSGSLATHIKTHNPV